MRRVSKSASKCVCGALRCLSRKFRPLEKQPTPARRRKSQIHKNWRRIANPRSSTKAGWRCRSLAAYVIASTSDMQLGNLAWCAAASLAMPIPCASRKAGRSDARSAMSSPFLCAADTIVKCIATVRKLNGGAGPRSIQSLPHALCGSNRIPDWPPQQAHNSVQNQRTAILIRHKRKSPGVADRAARPQNCETKPRWVHKIESSAKLDLFKILSWRRQSHYLGLDSNRVANSLLAHSAGITDVKCRRRRTSKASASTLRRYSRAAARRQERLGHRPGLRDRDRPAGRPCRQRTAIRRVLSKARLAPCLGARRRISATSAERCPAGKGADRDPVEYEAL